MAFLLYHMPVLGTTRPRCAGGGGRVARMGGGGPGVLAGMLNGGGGLLEQEARCRQAVVGVLSGEEEADLVADVGLAMTGPDHAHFERLVGHQQGAAAAGGDP